MVTNRTLVVDVGTSSIRAAVLDQHGAGLHSVEQESLPNSPADGLVEFDATTMAQTALELARKAFDDAGPVDAVGISNQRGSTIVWDRATGEPVGPGLGLARPANRWYVSRSPRAEPARRAESVGDEGELAPR